MLLLTLILLLTSCVTINKEYNENFKGSWCSVNESFEPLADEVVLHIAKDKVEVVIDGISRGVGRYYIREGQLIIGWSVQLDYWDIVLCDAALTYDNMLLLRWKPTGYYYSFTSVFGKE